MKCSRLVALVACLLLPPSFAFFGTSLGADAPGPPPTFEKDVLPIFEARCTRCHGGEKTKAQLDLRTRMTLLEGGDSGPSVAPGSANDSLLWKRISEDAMPPGKEKLSRAEKTTIERWINGGAGEALAAGALGSVRARPHLAERPVTDADRDFWSFRSPARPVLPLVPDSGRVRNPVDTFVLAALEKKGLTLSPEADLLTLLRRATFDLTGLPPTVKEIDDYLADKSRDAYEHLLDRLLASPHYGEHWGRHWLDLAGYADTEGVFEFDPPRAAAWRYRDYVIQSLNKDKPYDRFLQEQLAGDELVDYWSLYQAQKPLSPEVVEALVATGFLRCASDVSQPGAGRMMTAQYYQTLDDTVKIVSSSILGLTLDCARCHDHKYDPIPQADYYRVEAIFMSAYRPAQWVAQAQRRILESSAGSPGPAAIQADAAIAKLHRQADELKKQYAGYLYTGRLAKLPDPIREDVRRALTTPAARRTDVQDYLASKFEKELRPDSRTLDRVLPEAFVTYKTQLQEIEAAVKAEKTKRGVAAEIRALYDLPGETKTYILRRGDFLDPAQEVQPGVVSVLSTSQPFTWSPPAKDARTSGRRRAFARWLTQPDHPLTARVLVNHLWRHHFGEGLVATPDNFGRQGARPTHPELLDWLATEFVARGWSMKAMHRLIMTSSTYRQTSTFHPDAHATARRVDPENTLLWRQRMRRLEAEAVRDSVLSVSGTLNGDMFGPPVPVAGERPSDGEIVPPVDSAGRKRSIYLQARRLQPVTVLQVFDEPAMEINCTRRSTSTVASQALVLLNGEFFGRAAESFASRSIREKPDDPAGFAFLTAFSRPPSDAEHRRLVAFLDEQAALHDKQGPAVAKSRVPRTSRERALDDLCQMLLGANEFVYVD
jgi:hypothetical protein